MSLIVVTGSNQGNSIDYLAQAKRALARHWELIAQSRIYVSPAVDYEDQPDFFNQALEFKLPIIGPEEAMRFLLTTEKSMGRVRNVRRGPRVIDLDIIFWGTQQIATPDLIVPHPRWAERSFVVRPVSELPFFQTLEKWFTIPTSFKVEAHPL